MVKTRRDLAASRPHQAPRTTHLPFVLDLGLVNVVFLGEPGGPWILVDAGMAPHFGAIVKAAAERFGRDSKPDAIVLTHGHRDHVGSARALSSYWNTPIYIGDGDRDFVNGRLSWPEPDTTCGGPLALLFRLMPGERIDLGERLRTLPESGTLPGFPEWEIVALPGHTPGQVGFFRESDRTLIAGDALMSVDLDSWKGLAKSVTGWIFGKSRPGIYPPPTPSTWDWFAVRRSLNAIDALVPNTIIVGHGPTIGPELMARVRKNGFDRMSLARKGRFIADPIRREGDRVIVAPLAPDPAKAVVKGLVGAALLAGIGYLAWRALAGESKE